MHPLFALVLHVRNVYGIDVEVRYPYSREGRADFFKRPIPDVVAMSDKKNVRLEIFRRLDKFFVGDNFAYRSYA
jgi:hypothetical protein